MKLIYTFVILYLVPSNPASALTKKLESPSFIQTYDGGINMNELDVAKDNVEEMNTVIATLFNETNSVAYMTLTEKNQLMELLHFQYQEAISVINKISVYDFTQFQRTLKAVNDNDKLTERTLSKVARQLKSIAIMEERKNKYTAGQQKKARFGESRNNNRRRAKEDTFNYRKFSKSGHFQNMRGHEHHERYFKLYEAVQKGDNDYVNHHIFGDGHGSWSHSTGTHEGRRLARQARRLSSSTKNKKCEVLATCAQRMSFYDYFVFFFSDDIDNESGEVDENVKKLFDEKNVTATKKRINGLAKNVLENKAYFECDDLLAEFHRTVERDGVPEWEGATISQVCLAEGTTVYVKLAEAAATILPAPAEEDMCTAKKHQGRKGNGDTFIDSVSDDEKRNVICCSETEIADWKKNDDCDVYAASNIDGICYEDKTWSQADEICKSYGARLCTGRELLNSCAKDVGSPGCDFNTKEVWSDTCSDETFRKKYSGHYWNEKEMKSDWDRSNVVCCSDDEVDDFEQEDDCDIYTMANVGNLKLWHEAHKLCDDKGGRLCTMDEMLTSCVTYDNAWSSTPVLFETADEKAKVVNNQIQKEVDDVIIPGFIKEPLVCARNLFYSDDRKEDERYENEYFIFCVNGEDPKEDLNKYQIPISLNTDSPPRTEYGQMKNNSKPAFKFSSYQHLMDKYETCTSDAQARWRTTVEEEYGEKEFVSDSDIIEFMEKGQEKYMKTIKETCLNELLAVIDYGLKLVFGERASPGYICGVADAVAKPTKDKPKKDMPGRCCLDAPFDLDGEDWGYGYECSMECKNPGSFFAGMNEAACRAQGGTYCINQVDCTELKNCVEQYKDFATSKKLYAFKEYLNSSPKINDPKNFEQCGKAREYFGYQASYVNDYQVCEDVEQLAYSKDFEFLNEFFSQGNDGDGSGAVGPHNGGGAAAPNVPPLVLTLADTSSSDDHYVQDGQAWRATNFALSEAWSVWKHIHSNLEGAKCPCSPDCIAETICNSLKRLFSSVVKIVTLLLRKGLDISEFMMGQKAECNNIQPLETWEESQVIWENMDLTGKWLQDRFEDLGGYIEAETNKLYGKIDQLSKGGGNLYQRGLLNEADDELLLSRLLPVPDDYVEQQRRDDGQLTCQNLKIDVRTNNNAAAATATSSSSLRSFKCSLTCITLTTDNDEGKKHHAITTDLPDNVMLTVEGIDVSKKETFEIPIIYENEKVADGVYLIEIPDDVDTNVFIVKAAIISSGAADGNDVVVENEEMIVLPPPRSNKASSSRSSGSLFSFLFGFF